MSGALCEAVLDQPGAAATLAALARSNLLLVPLDRRGQWYRYHHLFRDMLLAELERTEPGLIPVLRRRAADWSLRNGLAEEALEYFMAAAAVDEAARLAAELSLQVYRQGRITTLQRWFRWLDERGAIEGYPMVAAYAAILAAQTGRAVEAERWADVVDRWQYGDTARADAPAAEAWAAVIRRPVLPAWGRADAGRRGRVGAKAQGGGHRGPGGTGLAGIGTGPVRRPRGRRRLFRGRHQHRGYRRGGHTHGAAVRTVPAGDGAQPMGPGRDVCRRGPRRPAPCRGRGPFRQCRGCPAGRSPGRGARRAPGTRHRSAAAASAHLRDPPSGRAGPDGTHPRPPRPRRPGRRQDAHERNRRGAQAQARSGNAGR